LILQLLRFLKTFGVKIGNYGNYIDIALKRKYSDLVGIKEKRHANENINKRALCLTINVRPCRA
jgi:hypothetical protein